MRRRAGRQEWLPVFAGVTLLASGCGAARPGAQPPIPAPGQAATSTAPPPPAAMQTLGAAADDPFGMDALPVFGLFANRHLLPWNRPLVQSADPIKLRNLIWDVRAQNERGVDTQADGLRLVRRLRAALPGARLGRYFSATGAVRAGTDMPFPRYVELPESQMLRRRDGTLMHFSESDIGGHFVADLTQPEVRRKVIELWVSQSAGWDFVAADNVIYKYTDIFDASAPGSARWFAAVRDLFAEYARRADRRPIIVNVAALPEETWSDLIPHVDGLMMEFAFASVGAEYAPRRLERTRGEMQAYRAALDAGRTVLLVSKGRTVEDAGRILSAAVCLLRNPGEPLYFNPDTAARRDYRFYDFYRWPARLGRPLEPCRWEGMIARRRFERGRVELDISTTQPAARVWFEE